MFQPAASSRLTVSSQVIDWMVFHTSSKSAIAGRTPTSRATTRPIDAPMLSTRRQRLIGLSLRGASESAAPGSEGSPSFGPISDMRKKPRDPVVAGGLHTSTRAFR